VVGGSEDGTACVWELPGGKLVRTIRVGAGVNDLVFTAQGDLLTADADGHIRRWSAATGAAKQTLWAAPYAVYSLAVRRDGLLAGCGPEGVVRLWDASKNPPRRKSWRVF